MAEENTEITENRQTINEVRTQLQEDMDVESGPLDESIDPEISEDLAEGVEKLSDSDNAKRAREVEENDGEDERAPKKPNLEMSVEEERLDELEAKEVGEVDGEDKKAEQVEDVSKEETEPGVTNVGPKIFSSSVEMFDYFYNLLHFWPPNLDINKYEHMVLLELLKKGHTDAARKIGEGIRAFQVRYHPTFKSKCFFLVRLDGSVDDFSFRKCVDHILPLPDNMKVGSGSGGKNGWGSQKGRGGGDNGGGRGHGHGRGRGGRGHGGRRR